MKVAAAILVVLAGAGCDERLERAPPAASAGPSPASVAKSPRATDHFATTEGDLAVAPLEHASLLFVWRGLAIYVDPASPVGDDPSLPKADLVFVTDAHYDHLDPFAIARLRKPGTRVVGSPAVGLRWPVDVILGEGETRSISRIDVSAVAAYSLVRGPGPGMLYHERGRSVGYVLSLGGTRVYVSGDTECTPEMRALANLDVAFVSMNVPYAMTAAEATSCVSAFRPKVAFPYAYRHSIPSTLDRSSLGPTIDVRRRELYPRADMARARAYAAFVHGMWGAADDLLDEAKRLDPDGDADWRVQWTRGWLREYERPWPW
jgi:L-ascorbate metabolism protein UlaG (beta-lactamase superfamily)